MENIRDILQREDIYLKNLTYDFCKRIQTLRRIEQSEEFAIANEQLISLKQELPFENISEPTLKKVIGNLLVSKHLKRRDNDKLLYELLQSDTSYRFYLKSFYYSKN
ncbi:hypothetical protein [Clostridium sp. YIM B02506]|uniref:hypothetical protein n=1 Tax=Clostridium sp. YIM B02506 TaxID=2910680 RepID=UPI001EEED9E3|nr:hypothetical protein [Clostridium sp. YIM B02506]